MIIRSLLDLTTWQNCLMEYHLDLSEKHSERNAKLMDKNIFVSESKQQRTRHKYLHLNSDIYTPETQLGGILFWPTRRPSVNALLILRCVVVMFTHAQIHY